MSDFNFTQAFKGCVSARSCSFDKKVVDSSLEILLSGTGVLGKETHAFDTTLWSRMRLATLLKGARSPKPASMTAFNRSRSWTR